jgi:2-polyprenyl-3-methyl-5-hydroxy-6-metoxy-1,4-benzoquinol methylase
VESAELIALLQTVRERVRAHNPQTAAGESDIALPDLVPLMHARDAALGKVAAIGTVNPRRGGPVNSLVQGWKRLVSRVLDWHVREQVEFNRNVVACVDTTLEALNESNRAMVEIGNRMVSLEAAVRYLTDMNIGERLGAVEPAVRALTDMELGAHFLEVETRIDAARSETGQIAADFDDLRKHWAEWRPAWEKKLDETEIRFLRSIADTEGAAQLRATLMENTHRDAMRAQHADFASSLEKSATEIQQRLWADLERIRRDYESIIHSELRTIRQRAQIVAASAPAPAAAAPNQPAAAPPAALGFDYGRFAERFRGPEEYVKAGQQFYLPYFKECRNVLDLGCGRGEFMEMLQQAGIPVRGIDLGEESIALCRQKGLDAENADLFECLSGLAEHSLDGIFCSQVVEHLPPERLPEMVRLSASRLAPGGVIAIETPNPECLAIFSTHFYLDPTHTRPVPPALLAFYMEEFGIGGIGVHRRAPAVESMPSLAELPPEFREAFFGGLDYAIIGRKL